LLDFLVFELTDLLDLLFELLLTLVQELLVFVLVDFLTFFELSFLFVQVRTDIVTRMSGLVVTYVLMCSA
jgi:hypothetical protein